MAMPGIMASPEVPNALPTVIPASRTECVGPPRGAFEPRLRGDPLAEQRGEVDLVPAMAALLGGKAEFAEAASALTLLRKLRILLGYSPFAHGVVSDLFPLEINELAASAWILPAFNGFAKPL